MRIKLLFLGLFLSVAGPALQAQILCINCFNTNDSISDNVTNLIVNGSFENTTCTPNSNGNSWCPVSMNYNCDIANWTCTGGGTQTYCQMFTTMFSAVPDGNVAAYFGNSFCNVCGVQGDISCLTTAPNSCEMTGVPAGLPENDPVAYGGTNGLSLSQTVNGLTPGSVYVLEFWTGGEDFQAFTDPGMFGLDIGFGYTYLQTLPTDFGDIGLHYVVQWQATAASHTIKFTNWGHICGSCSELTLDHVRLYPLSQLDPSVAPCAVVSNPTVTITPVDASCNGLCNGQATANPANGTPPYTFAWSNGQTTQTITNLCPGNYSVTITDSTGATANASTTISQPANLNVSTSFTPSNCNDDSGTATVTPNNGIAPFTFQWSSGTGNQTTATAVDLFPGNYTVTVTDSAGCTGTASVIIPTSQLTEASWTSTAVSNCFDNNQFNLLATGNNPPGATFAWTFQNGQPPNSSVINPTVSFTQAGNNTVTLIVTAGTCSDTLTQVLFVFPPVVVDAGPDVSFCEGENGAELSGTGQGGTPIPPGNGYYWTWWCDSTNTWCALDSVFDNNPNATPAQSTMYYVQITDFNGCVSNIDSAMVNVIPKPLVFAGPDVYICADSAPCTLLAPSVTNSAGPFSFQWSPSIGLNDPTLPNPCARPDTTTMYTLVVTDLGTGCNSTLTTVDTNSTLTVHVNPLPVAHAGDDVDICLGDSIMLNGIGTGAGPAYDFEWSPANGVSNVNDANPMVSPASTTEYVLTVWSNSCPSIGDTIVVNVHTIPTVNAGPDVDICLGEIGMLDAQASGDPLSTTYTYEWSPPNGVIGSTSVEDLLASPTSTTTYSVVATSEFGCVSPPDEAILTIRPQPFPDAGGPFTICAGDTVDLNGTIYYTTTPPVPDPSQIVITWYPGSNISSTTTAQTSVWPASTGYYYMQLDYITCRSLDSVLINVMPTPVAIAGADTTVICSGDSVLIWGGGGQGGAVYTWTPGDGLPTTTGDSLWASPEETTTYIFTASEGQCLDRDTLTLEVIPSPVAAYMSSFTEGCAPLEVSFLSLSSDAILQSWNFGDGSISNDLNPMHTYTQPGTYQVTLTAVNTGACEDKVSDLTVHVFEPPTADFTSVPPYPAELVMPASGVQFNDQSSATATTWTWNFGDGVSAAEQNPMHTFMQEGTYYVSLTVQNEQGCTHTVTHGPYTVVSPELFIPNVFSPNEDGINDVFFIRYTGSQPFQLNIFDRWGNLLYSDLNKTQGWDGTSKNVAVPEGVYYYNVHVGDKEYTGSVTLVR